MAATPARDFMHISHRSIRTILTLPFDQMSPRPSAKRPPAGTLSSRELQKIVADIIG
jgi:hypothetical protein